jgi:predicted phosphoribosyltransferase/erythromycin esterase-like protein
VERFRDRAEAGRRLALRLPAPPGAIVLGLARGGIPVAAEVARALQAPLDAVVARELRVPDDEPLPLGALGADGVRVLNHAAGVAPEAIAELVARETRLLEREALAVRGDRPPPDVRGRTVILVDDGLAGEERLRAAEAVVRQDDPEDVVTAVPGAPVAYDDPSLPADAELRALLDRPPAAAPLRPLDGYDELIERAARVRRVVIGTETHGSRELHRERAELTKRLIADAGFTALALEADWRPAARVRRFLAGDGDDAEEALAGFPWIWRTPQFAGFLGWLRANAPGTGVHGLDLYAFDAAREALAAALDQMDPGAARRLRERFARYDHVLWEADFVAEPYERQAVDALVELRLAAPVVADAAEFYHALLHSTREAWEIRERHMADVLAGLEGRVVVWCHNLHAGARPRSLGARARPDALLVGMTTYAGMVAAAREWGGDPEPHELRPALAGSWQERFHVQHEAHGVRRLARSVGAVYEERYLDASLGEAFDAVVHVDETTAATSLPGAAEGWLPETYPFGV